MIKDFKTIDDFKRCNLFEAYRKNHEFYMIKTEKDTYVTDSFETSDGVTIMEQCFLLGTATLIDKVVINGKYVTSVETYSKTGGMPQ